MLTVDTQEVRALVRLGDATPDVPQSDYLHYLPAIYAEDPFMGRFLRIFESIEGPISTRISLIYRLFDPANTSPDMLPWLASWLGLVLDENWPMERRRALVAEGSALYRWRGTRRGLRRYLELYTGVAPEISDSTEGFALGPNARLGQNTNFGQAAPPNTFIVSFSLTPATRRGFNEAAVRHIIETEKPAHAAYILEVR